jgi:ABC-type Zn uptake system ZnuABC Zn-binding protein ZnuA
MSMRSLLTLLLLTFLCTCGRAQETERKFLVVTSASIFADMTEVIAGGLVDVQSIVPIGGDPHIYEPTPSNVQLVSRANLVLVNGLTFEGWVNELIENSGTVAETVTITEGIGAIASDEYANASDPHAWMTARNGMTYVRNIRDALIRLDPANKEVYEFNAGIYLQQLEDLDKKIFDQIESIPEARRVLITSHDAFRYYGRYYGIRVEAALGTSTDAQVQTDDVNRLTKIIRESGVPAIFVESTINPKLIRQLATDNKVIIGGELLADSLDEPTKEGGTYLGMLTFNTNTIVAALKGQVEDVGIGMGPSGSQQAILLAIILAVMAGAFFFMVARINRGVA